MTVPTRAEDHWTTFDSTDVALVTKGLAALEPEALAPEARSRLLELKSIFIQRETAYYGT